MDEAAQRALVASARVGHLATLTPDGRPHLVPCCFAVGDERIWTAVDRKPKRTLRLQRLANVRAHPRASLLVDHYEEDWTRLWWVRVDAAAAVLEDGPEREAALALLAAKYPQYREAPPEGAVIALTPDRWRSWSAG
jgi:PPOX class probable F420-dependent enzyme